MWVLLGVISSLFLGVYDILKKASLKENAVIPVLFFSTLTSGLIFLPFLLLNWFWPETATQLDLQIPAGNLMAQLHFFAKACIVAVSWILAYFSLKHLPISIVTPIRASGPVWTLIGAITFLFYYLFSLAGKKEGIHFHRNKWVLFIFLATIVGTISALYDKYLTAIYDRLSIQAYFSIYMVIIYLAVFFWYWYPQRKKPEYRFEWRNTIPLIGIFLVIADFTYFYSLSYDESLISILSALRRSSVIYSFLFGAIIFREKNKKLKGLLLLGILVGIILIIFGST